MKPSNKKDAQKFYPNVSNDMPPGIIKNFEELEKVEAEMFNIYETVRTIAKGVYICTESFQSVRLKEKNPNPQEFDECLHRLSELFHPNSLLGYILNIVAENGFVRSELINSQNMSIQESVLHPFQVLIKTYPVLNKFRYIINTKFETLQGIKEKIKLGYKADTPSQQHPTLILHELGVKFEESQKQVIAKFNTFIVKEQQTVKKLIDMLEIKQNYHQSCLKEIESSLETIKNRLNGGYRAPIFRVPLRKHLENTKSEISVLIHDAVAWIMNNGLSEEGIFRQAANKIKVSKLVAAYDSGISIPSDFIPTVHVMCAALKQYLRTLPDSLLFKDCTTAYLTETFKLPSSAVDERLKLVIDRLPRDYYKNLKYLFTFLREVSRNHKSNRMNASNLGLVFGPSLITGITLTDEDVVNISTSAASVVSRLIDNYDKFFPDGCKLKVDHYLRICTMDERATTPVKVITKPRESADEADESQIEPDENCMEPPYYFTNSIAYEYHRINREE